MDKAGMIMGLPEYLANGAYSITRVLPVSTFEDVEKYTDRGWVVVTPKMMENGSPGERMGILLREPPGKGSTQLTLTFFDESHAVAFYAACVSSKKGVCVAANLQFKGKESAIFNPKVWVLDDIQMAPRSPFNTRHTPEERTETVQERDRLNEAARKARS